MLSEMDIFSKMRTQTVVQQTNSAWNVCLENVLSLSIISFSIDFLQYATWIQFVSVYYEQWQCQDLICIVILMV